MNAYVQQFVDVTKTLFAHYGARVKEEGQRS
jgi:hypothetical protein